MYMCSNNMGLCFLPENYKDVHGLMYVYVYVRAVIHVSHAISCFRLSDAAMHLSKRSRLIIVVRLMD